MILFPHYKAIKTKLGAVTPVFFFIGQYASGKDNTSYKVPAIYIEMPKDNNLQFYGKRIMAAKCNIKIHYISHAPFKNHDSIVQDNAIAAHENKLLAIDLLIKDFDFKDGNGRLLMQALTPVGSNTLNFKGDYVYSVITYATEVYSYHQQG